MWRNFVPKERLFIKIIFRLEDKTNRYLKQLLESQIIDQSTFHNSLYSTGSFLCSFYGLSKIHRDNLPLWPILEAYNATN